VSRCRYDIVCRQIPTDAAMTSGSARRFARRAILISSPNCRFQAQRFVAGFTVGRSTLRPPTHSKMID
jgi:hypothetical protein